MNETVYHTTQLCQVGRLLGRLLIGEIDRELAVHLASPEIGEALGALELNVNELEAATSTPAGLDTLAADYFDAMINPRGHAPLIQSVWESGLTPPASKREAKTLSPLKPGVEALARL